MSYQIGMDCLNLKPTPRLAHTEYCDHGPLMRHVTGLPEGAADLARSFYDRWSYDFVWSTTDDPVPWEQRGRVTDMGHAVYMENGMDRRDAVESPFRTPEEVLSFDAVAEYGLTDMDVLVSAYEGRYQQARRDFPDQVWTGGYYRTLVSGAIAVFGWDMLLLGAAYLDRFTRVLDSIYQQTLRHCQAWAQTSSEVYMCHDDMVWTMGPFIRPDYYRAEIFPRYKALWKVLHDAGKKVVFTSDGDWTMFVDDIVEAGADALCFEPMVSLDVVAERYGKTHCILGSSVDARTLTFRTRDDIKQQLDDTLRAAEMCNGLMVAVGNHIPANIPLDNALFYYEYLSSHWGR